MEVETTSERNHHGPNAIVLEQLVELINHHGGMDVVSEAVGATLASLRQGSQTGLELSAN